MENQVLKCDPQCSSKVNASLFVYDCKWQWRMLFNKKMWGKKEIMATWKIRTAKTKRKHKKWLVLGHIPHTFQLPHFCDEKFWQGWQGFSFCSPVWKLSFLITVFLFLVMLTWLHGESLEGFMIMLKLWQACCNRWIWHIVYSELYKKGVKYWSTLPKLKLSLWLWLLWLSVSVYFWN